MICGSVNEQTQRMNIPIISGPYIDLDSTDPRPLASPKRLVFPWLLLPSNQGFDRSRFVGARRVEQ